MSFPTDLYRGNMGNIFWNRKAFGLFAYSPITIFTHFPLLLLQVASEYNEKEKAYDILWGDCGVANFFISRGDLKSLNFQDVIYNIYNWDCC